MDPFIPFKTTQNPMVHATFSFHIIHANFLCSDVFRVGQYNIMAECHTKAFAYPWADPGTPTSPLTIILIDL